MAADPATSRLVTMPTGVPELTLGWEAIRWATKYLRHPNGPRAGLNWEFIESQWRFLLWWYAVDEQGRWLYHHSARRLVKGAGKACDLNTPIPTPSGWSAIGDLSVGDYVFDEQGLPCRVVGATEVMHDHDCYEVTFRDGTTVVADADHVWPVIKFCGSTYVEKALTTREMAEIGVTYRRPLTKGRTKCSKADVAMWRSLPTPSLDLPEADLPLPPYVLGYWLGNGDSNGPRLTTHLDDATELTHWLESAGVTVDRKQDQVHDGRLTAARLKFSFDGVTGSGIGALRALGVLNDKHVPMAVLRASRAQRLECLRGIMDSDGHVDKRGKIEICFTSKQLADGVVALARTLGLYPRMKSSDAKIYGRVVGTRYRISLTVYAEEPIAHLQRKVDRLIPRPTQHKRLYSQSRTITSIQRVDSVPVRCITVDSPSSLYLCGTGMVPTHNSPFAGLVALVELCAPVRVKDFDPKADGGVVGKPVDMPWVQIAAVSASQTANTMRMVRALAAKGSRLAAEYRLDPGITKIYKPPNGILEVITSSASTAEGAEISFVVMDEVEHWLPATGGPIMAETLDRNLAKSGSRAMETSNAWQPGQDSVAEATYDAWVLQEEGRTRGTSKILYDARIAPPDTDLADEASLMKGLAAAYGDCWWVDLNVLKERVWSPKTRPEVARRFYLNQPTASEESWVTPMEWAACVDTTRLVADDEDIAMFFDGSKSRDATALMGCAMSDGHVFTLGVWEPDPKHDTESVIPVAHVDAAVAQAFDRFSVVAFFADVSEWEGYVKTTWPERYRDQLLVWSSPNTKESHPIAWDMRTRNYDFTMAVELTHEDIVSRQLTHDGDSRVARHVINAHRRPNRWGCSIGKETKDSPKKVDAAVCVVGARMVRRLVMSSPEWAKRSEPVRSGRVFGF